MGLCVESSGSGPDLALLHGWGMNAAVWDDLAALLAKTFRVHCVDLPGCGASPACVPYTLDALADVLAAVLPQRLVVCGWSFGGQLALDWALRAPARVDRLVLIATTPRFVRDTGWESGIDAAVLDGFAHGLVRDYRGTLQRFLALQAQSDVDARTVLRRLRGQILMRSEPDIAALEAGLRILKETDLRDKLSRIPQPALILHGAHDTIVPLAAGQYLQRALPRATLEVLAGAAHAPFVARPQRAAQCITEFCGER